MNDAFDLNGSSSIVPGHGVCGHLDPKPRSELKQRGGKKDLRIELSVITTIIITAEIERFSKVFD